MAIQQALFGEGWEASPTTHGAREESAASEALFGFDPEPGIVAVEPGEATVRRWIRRADDSIEIREEPFRPWLITPESADEAERAAVEHTLLEGLGFRFLYEFGSWTAFQSVRLALQDRHAEQFSYPSAIRQSLVRSGKTLFKGMTLAGIHRMQFDIETETLSPDADSARILLIAVRDNRGLLETLDGPEPDLLRRFACIVRERDPDVLEGHNVYGFDLPYLLARSERLGVPLALGRDGSPPRVGRQRNFAIGGITRPFNPVYIYGRHLVDTYLAVQRFDWAKGALASYGLKEAARAFGISVEDRVELPRGEIGRIFAEDPELVREYARQDVLETGRLAEIVTPTEFYMAQMVPDSYGSGATSGTGDKINQLFVRAYLCAARAIPRPSPPRAYPGGYTEVRATGVIERVVKADVESLYPSLMLTEQIRPESDSLGIFLPALAELTRRRFEAKARARESTGSSHHYWDGLQGSFKVLINSFYGYLGAPAFHFNDYTAAERVTERGRELVQQIAARLEGAGARVIEIDTDGVYFTPPESVQGEERERAFVAKIGESLPEGIRLAFDGRYQAMLSLKTKNYVLAGYDGSRVFKGASLRSRADEPFGREFLTRAADLLLDGKQAEVGELYRDVARELEAGSVPIQKLARRERITDKTFSSAGKQRSAEVARDLPVGEYMTVYERREGSLGLLSEYEVNGRDISVEYYTDKLYKFASRLREAFDSRFDEIIPSPRRLAQELSGQASLDLF